MSKNLPSGKLATEGMRSPEILAAIAKKWQEERGNEPINFPLISKETGMPLSTIYHLKGDKLISLENAKKIAGWLNIPVTDIAICYLKRDQKKVLAELSGNPIETVEYDPTVKHFPVFLEKRPLENSYNDLALRFLRAGSNPGGVGKYLA